jgi:hypothetical protein
MAVFLLALAGVLKLWVGMTKFGEACVASPDGYYDIEDQVVPAIIAWIKAL